MHFANRNLPYLRLQVPNSKPPPNQLDVSIAALNARLLLALLRLSAPVLVRGDLAAMQREPLVPPK